MLRRDQRLGPRAAYAFASYVRTHPISGLAVVKAATVQAYVTTVGQYLIRSFPLCTLSDWRLVPGSPLRDSQYNALIRSLSRRDPMRMMRLPLSFSILKAAHNADVTSGVWHSSRHLFRWSALALYFGFRGAEFLDTPHGRKRRSRRGYLCILLKDVTFYGADGRLLNAPFPRRLAARVRVVWTWQKNGQHGQSRDMNANGDPLFCPVALFLDATEHCCGTTSGGPGQPLAVGAQGRHITTAVMDTYIKRAVLAWAPNTPPGELKRYTSHSYRVGALQRLLAQPHMKVALAVEFLRWRSEAYILYIRTASFDFSRLSAADASSMKGDFLADASYVSDDDSDSGGDQ